jgi:hypothetical protein
MAREPISAGPGLRIIRLIGDSSEFNFLDNRSGAASSRVNEYTA